MSMEANREAEELLLSSSTLHIAIVFALMDEKSLYQQHILGATEFLPGLPKAAWMKVFTLTLPCMDTPEPTVAVGWCSDSAGVSPKLGSTIPKVASLQVEL